MWHLISRSVVVTVVHMAYFRNLSTNCRRGESVTIVNAYLSRFVVQFVV